MTLPVDPTGFLRCPSRSWAPGAATSRRQPVEAVQPAADVDLDRGLRPPLRLPAPPAAVSNRRHGHIGAVIAAAETVEASAATAGASAIGPAAAAARYREGMQVTLADPPLTSRLA